jgi:dTDP-4-dehydrorhamnose reductase
MKIILTGANGFLGQHASLFFADKGFDVYAVSRNESRIPFHKNIFYQSTELTNVSSVNKMVDQIKPDIIIHNAAMSKPDECEQNKDACILHNVTATQYLVDAANKHGVLFIYISTDFIFGENGPHPEDALPQPLNFYGKSKLMAEEFVKTFAFTYSIVRPVFIYGSYWEGMRPSFIQWVQQNLAVGKSIKVVDDQFRTPTYMIDICKGIEQIIVQKKHEIFHLAGSEILTPYAMAIQVAEILALNAALVTKVDSFSFPEPVLRAKRSGLLIDKARQLLNYQPLLFEEGVKLSFKNLL